MPSRLPHPLAQPLAQESNEEPVDGLHIVLTSFDGHMYIVDGKSACIDKIDLGENSYRWEEGVDT